MSNIETRQPEVRHLRDDELNAVNGAKGAGFRVLAQILGELENKQAAKLKS